MGGKVSKNIETIIDDYSKVKIPKDYTLIKVGSYNVDLRNTINLDNKTKEIIHYITNDFKKKNLDIICLQGFYDNVSVYFLIEELKRYCYKYKTIFYLAPELNININLANQKKTFPSPRKMIELSFHSSDQKKKNIISKKKRESIGSSDNKKKKFIQNIIISKYQIINTIFSELDDKTDMDDILGIHTVIGANILIGNTIVSIYNTTLSKDIKTANVINTQVRLTELDTLDEVITQNKNNMKDTKYINSDVHLILGTININESDQNGINQEYVDFIMDRKYVDIFRYFYPDDDGYTTAYKERINYILMNLTEDVYDKDNEIYKNFKDVNSGNQLFELIFKRYGIYFMDIYTIKKIDNNTLINYPLECIFLIKNK